MITGIQDVWPTTNEPVVPPPVRDVVEPHPLAIVKVVLLEIVGRVHVGTPWALIVLVYCPLGHTPPHPAISPYVVPPPNPGVPPLVAATISPYDSKGLPERGGEMLAMETCCACTFTHSSTSTAAKATVVVENFMDVSPLQKL